MRKGKLKGILKEISYYKGIRRRKLKGNATRNTQRINTKENTKNNARRNTKNNTKENEYPSEYFVFPSV